MQQDHHGIHDGIHRGIHHDYWSALEAGSRLDALAALKQLAEAGHGSLQLIHDVILPAQERVGRLWESGEWSVDQERAATAVNEGLVHWLCSFTDAPGPDRPLVLVGCLAGEDHALPALVLAEGLQAAGYRVHLVTADRDPDEVLAQVAARRPRAVLLSGSLTSSLARQVDLFAAVTATGVPLVVGGRAFAGDARRAAALGATAYAADLQEAVRLLETLPRRVAPRPRPEPGPAEAEARWILAYAHEITPYVVRALASEDRAPVAAPAHRHDELTSHVEHVLGCLAATLVTGDETIMVELGEWLERVLTARGARPGVAARVWALVATPLQRHPLARQHLAAAAPTATTQTTPTTTKAVLASPVVGGPGGLGAVAG